MLKYIGMRRKKGYSRVYEGIETNRKKDLDGYSIRLSSREEIFSYKYEEILAGDIICLVRQGFEMIYYLIMEKDNKIIENELEQYYLESKDFQTASEIEQEILARIKYKMGVVVAVGKMVCREFDDYSYSSILKTSNDIVDRWKLLDRNELEEILNIIRATSFKRNWAQQMAEINKNIVETARLLYRYILYIDDVQGYKDSMEQSLYTAEELKLTRELILCVIDSIEQAVEDYGYPRDLILAIHNLPALSDNQYMERLLSIHKIIDEWL